ncbi:hypothetical protein D9613_010541 [Agrocybe pediades]|uniref:N-acetyltransferase domain-containing protein n=1 Tax=Agrocybe pediades TaxID=84607 RepID=A0A8H4QFQ2_9AGAR|nr:hypothetical protein D9613_010541 [Agrocybe pediades]
MINFQVIQKMKQAVKRALAGDLFLGAYEADRKLIGYICSTLSPDNTLTHESMSKHIPNSSYVCIHSICVAPSHKRKGVGLSLLREYVTRLERAAKYDRILLIAHEELRGFYEKAGFEWLGKSQVVHGSKPWFEMRRELRGGVPQSDTQVLGGDQPIPAGVIEALQRKRTNIPSTKLISDFEGGVFDLLEPESDAGYSVNKYDLLCPRKECGSIIIKKGVGQWVERASVQIEPEGSQPKGFEPLPPPPETAQWWLVRGSPMKFENVGFTRPAQPTASGPRLKLLTCGECDLGPLGWSEEGGSEYWLVCSRVAYRS